MTGAPSPASSWSPTPLQAATCTVWPGSHAPLLVTWPVVIDWHDHPTPFQFTWKYIRPGSSFSYVHRVQHFVLATILWQGAAILLNVFMPLCDWLMDISWQCHTHMFLGSPVIGCKALCFYKDTGSRKRSRWMASVIRGLGNIQLWQPRVGGLNYWDTSTVICSFKTNFCWTVWM